MQEVSTITSIFEKHGPFGLVLIIALVGIVWLGRFFLKQAQSNQDWMHTMLESHLETQKAHLETQQAHLKAVAELIVSLKEGELKGEVRHQAVLRELSQMRSDIMNNLVSSK